MMLPKILISITVLVAACLRNSEGLPTVINCVSDSAFIEVANRHQNDIVPILVIKSEDDERKNIIDTLSEFKFPTIIVLNKAKNQCPFTLKYVDTEYHYPSVYIMVSNSIVARVWYEQVDLREFCDKRFTKRQCRRLVKTVTEAIQKEIDKRKQLEQRYQIAFREAQKAIEDEMLGLVGIKTVMKAKNALALVAAEVEAATGQPASNLLINQPEIQAGNQTSNTQMSALQPVSQWSQPQESGSSYRQTSRASGSAYNEDFRSTRETLSLFPIKPVQWEEYRKPQINHNLDYRGGSLELKIGGTSETRVYRRSRSRSPRRGFNEYH